LAEKREVCRSYRSRRRTPKTRVASPSPGFLGVYDPFTRTVYTDDIADALPLLDAVLEIDRKLNPAHAHSRPQNVPPIWPDRASIQRQRPAEFNAMIDQLVLRHCAG
jgi:hypothetical protein